jgi:hypothetical protein
MFIVTLVVWERRWKNGLLGPCLPLIYNLGFSPGPLAPFKHYYYVNCDCIKDTTKIQNRLELL